MLPGRGIPVAPHPPEEEGCGATVVRGPCAKPYFGMRTVSMM